MKRVLLGLGVVIVVLGALAYLFRTDLTLWIVRNVASQNMRSSLLDTLPDGLHVALCGAGVIHVARVLDVDGGRRLKLKRRTALELDTQAEAAGGEGGDAGDDDDRRQDDADLPRLAEVERRLAAVEASGEAHEITPAAAGVGVVSSPGPLGSPRSEGLASARFQRPSRMAAGRMKK